MITLEPGTARWAAVYEALHQFVCNCRESEDELVEVEELPAAAALLESMDAFYASLAE